MIRVYDGDAFDLLPAWSGPLVTSLPTASELELEPGDWWHDFVPRAVLACLDAARGYPAVFVQTDRLAGGITYSWPSLFPVMTWHKIALTRHPGRIDLHRPAYRHIIAVGGRPGLRSPDVDYDGHRLWPNGTGVQTAGRVAAYLAEVAPGATVLNPFCGVGTLLYALGTAGLDGIGCDLDPERAETARGYTAAFVGAPA